MSRQPIGKTVRFEIFKRDGFECQYCGAAPPGVVLEIDHITPVAEGGDNDPTNLVTACFNCNRGKAARSLDKIPKPLSEMAENVAEREAQIAGYAAIMEARRARIEEDAWRVAETLEPGAEAGFPSRNLVSIKRFLRDIPVHQVIDAAEIAVARGFSKGDTFKYFCGICWKMAKEWQSL